MTKLLLLSVLIALVVVPVWAARDFNGPRGLKRAIFWVLAFNLAYALALQFIYPQLAG